MNENARKWVEALKSDEFKQGRRRLRTDGAGIEDAGGDYFCCLGVGCELYRRETGQGDWHGSGFFTVGVGVDRTSNLDLPLPVADWLGLASRDGRYNQYDGVQRFLTSDNDSGKTFGEIAAHVEAEPEGLFA